MPQAQLMYVVYLERCMEGYQALLSGLVGWMETSAPSDTHTWHIRIPVGELNLFLNGPLKGAFVLYIWKSCPKISLGPQSNQTS